MKPLTVLAFVLLVGCTYRAKEISHETAIVVGKSFTPKWSSIDVGTGMSSGGHMVTTISSSGQPDKYAVIFHCQHGVTFPILSERLYTELSEKDTVDISYYDITDKKGNIKDFQFVNAVKISK